MAVVAGVREYTFDEDGRVIVAGASEPRFDGMVELSTDMDADFGGGTLSVLVSYEAAPDVDDDSHWSTVEGLDDLSEGFMYRVQVRAPTVAVKLSGGNSPDFIVRVL